MDFIEKPDEALRKFLSSEQRRVHAGYILRQITKQYTTDKRISPLRENLKNNADEGLISKLINELVSRTVKEQEFTASIIPTVVSSDKARSMKMLGGEKPSEESAAIYWIYLQISGVLVGGNIVNLLYVDEAARLSFLDQLIDKGVLVLNKASIDKNELKKVLGRRFPLDLEFCSAFAFLNYFAHWVKNNAQVPKQSQDKFGIPKYLYKTWALSEKTTLAVISMPAGREKRGLYFVPKVSSFLTRWYGDYWSSKDKYPPLGRFISSLYDPDRGDESGPLLNSFLYDLMLNNRVNGPLLSRLVTMRADNVLTPKKRGKGAETVDCAPYFLQNTGGTKRLSGVGQQYRGGADTISLNSSP